MLRRRVPVFRLGSRGPGGDASCCVCGRKRPQSFAIVRNRSQSFALVRKRPQSFAEGRTCQRDENRRETQDCRHFWTRLASSRLKSVNSDKDPGGSWSRNARLSSLLDSSRVFAYQKCQQSQGSGESWPRNAELASRLETVTGIGRGRGRETQNCRHFWTRLGSSRLKSVNSDKDPGGSWSRNARLSSLLDSSCVFAS